MTGQRPSVIVARYVAGELSREQADERLAGAAWDDSYARASMEPGGDYDGDEFSDEGFAAVVYVPTSAGRLDAADYEAFSEAFARWRGTQHG